MEVGSSPLQNRRKSCHRFESSRANAKVGVHRGQPGDAAAPAESTEHNYHRRQYGRGVAMSAITYDPLHRSSIQSLSVEVAKCLGALSFGRQRMSVSLAVVQMYYLP